ncbi:MAG: TRAM domain-containing protein [Peptococcaceae bacterium]|nr:TRAM domain-containing protein [Peptococcaceae bacterium]
MRILIALVSAGVGFLLNYILMNAGAIGALGDLVGVAIEASWVYTFLVYAFFIIVFGVLGYLVAPAIMRFAGATVKWIEGSLVKMSLVEIISGTIGLFLGVLLATLFNSAYMSIPVAGPIISVVVSILLGYLGGYLGLVVGAKRREDIQGMMSRRKDKHQEKTERQEKAKADKKAEAELVSAPNKLYKILDTSVIIDGRIADILDTGFLDGTLLVPEFVLDELQRIADSSDMLKRNRGRRGLDILNHISKKEEFEMEISNRDFDDVTEVDSKLVRLAQSMKMPILTNDYNLNKIAELHGVKVLNINELANMVKPVVLPGETMIVQVLKEGKEAGQGVAYLEDGTMVVVDGGRHLIGQEASVTVTTVLQTSAGRMIFVKPKDDLEDQDAARYYVHEAGANF